MSRKRLTVTFKGYESITVFYNTETDEFKDVLDRAAKRATRDRNAFWFQDVGISSGSARYGQIFSSRDWGNTSVTGKISCDVNGAV